jgi:hypothetical protein
MQLVDDRARRRELAEFLRTRRERLSPQDVGLAAGPRRRTPGLRREEVAELAGIGTAWYTWLEQARDIKPSEGSVRQIARALLLDDTSKRYLLDLALERAPRVRREEVVTPGMQSMLSALSSPAYIRGQRWDLLAYNYLADALFDFAHIPDRNLLRNLFRPELRGFNPNWEAMARQHVAMFRSDCAGLLHDPWIRDIVDDLKECSSDFRAWWAEQTVSEQHSGHKTFDHPLLGRLHFDFNVFIAADSHNLKLVIYSADGQETERCIEQLHCAKKRGELLRGPGLWKALRVRQFAGGNGGR